MIEYIKKYKTLRNLGRFYLALGNFFSFRIFSFGRELYGYIKDYIKLKKNTANNMGEREFFPCFGDKTASTQIEPIYFYQGCRCASKIFNKKPDVHYDIGSQAIMVGIISQFVPTIMVDIRPIELKLPGLSFLEGSILNLPFKDNEIQSLSAICVIEHIGLGRYGDPIDVFGTEKSVKELSRVMKAGGDLYISVPMGIKNQVQFNAHRVFEINYIKELFKDFEILENKYINGNNLEDVLNKDCLSAVGLFHFQKK